MLEIRHLIALTDAYRAADPSGIDDGQLSWRVFGDSKKVTALREGRDITVSRFNAAMQWFSENWPADAEWPADVPRPRVPETAP